MAWLLSKPKVRRRRRSAARWPRWDPQRSRVALKTAAALAIVAVNVGLWSWAERRLGIYAISHSTGRMGNDRVVLADAPSWMGRSIRDRLQSIATAQTTTNPLDRSSLEQVFAALQKIAWVKQVHQVRRTAKGQLVIKADYRRPVAIVDSRDGYHLVDCEGIRLPGLYLRHTALQLGLPLIIGTSGPPPSVGHPWTEIDLAAGIAVVQALTGQPYVDQIRAVDVSSRDPMGRVHLVLRTRHGLVRWGLAPGQEHPIEPDAQIKKQLLATVAAEHAGKIDAGGRIVDIYDGNIFLHMLPQADGAVPTGYTGPW